MPPNKNNVLQDSSQQKTEWLNNYFIYIAEKNIWFIYTLINKFCPTAALSKIYALSKKSAEQYK
jgi:hypothetical protein